MPNQCNCEKCRRRREMEHQQQLEQERRMEEERRREEEQRHEEEQRQLQEQEQRREEERRRQQECCPEPGHQDCPKDIRKLEEELQMIKDAVKNLEKALCELKA